MKKRILTLITLLIVILNISSATAVYQDDSLTVVLQNKVLTISGTGTITEKVILQCRVRGVEELIIEDGITRIGAYAFSDCRDLKNVVIGNSVEEIAECAFRGCNLRTIVMGTAIKRIAKNSFGGFYHSEGFWPITLYRPKVFWLGETPPEGYDYVDSYVNYAPNNSYSELRATLVYPLLEHTFEVGGIRYIPRSLTDQTCDVFDYDPVYLSDSISHISIDSIVEYKGKQFKVQNINPYAFYECKKLKSICIDIAGDIEFRAFSYCNNLEELTITHALTIGYEAFFANYKLKKVSLDPRIKRIEKKAFQACICLTNFIIPDSVSVLNMFMLKDCYSLESIVIHKHIKEVQENVFDECTKLLLLTIEDRVDPLLFTITDYRHSFDATRVDSLYIGANIVVDTLRNGKYPPLFSNTTLRSVRIGGMKTRIEKNEFAWCLNLANVYIGNSVKEIGKRAFCGCHSLQNVIIPDSICVIEEEAFKYCASMKSITLGANLQKIHSHVFATSREMREIICKAEVPPHCFPNALDGIDKAKCKLIVPDSSVKAYKNADGWKEFFDINGITTNVNVVHAENEKMVKVYTLNGILISVGKSIPKFLPKGIYIVNGKKMVVQ